MHLSTNFLLLLVAEHCARSTAAASSVHSYSYSNAPLRNPASGSKRSRPQVVIYDPHSDRQLEPLQYLPIKVGQKRKPSQPTGNLVELPALWNPCSCSDFLCMCCLGLRLGDSFNHRICVALQYNSAQIALEMRINYNKRTIIGFNFSARNPPAYCIPLLIPLPVYTCLRLYDIRTYGGNVQVCLSLVLNAWSNQLFEFHFDCVRFGVNGVQFLKPTTQVDVDEQVTSIEVETEEVKGGGDVGVQRRQNIKLDEDYSGISVEGDDRDGFFRKGRVRG